MKWPHRLDTMPKLSKSDIWYLLRSLWWRNLGVRCEVGFWCRHRDRELWWSSRGSSFTPPSGNSSASSERTQQGSSMTEFHKVLTLGFFRRIQSFQSRYFLPRSPRCVLLLFFRSVVCAHWAAPGKKLRAVGKLRNYNILVYPIHGRIRSRNPDELNHGLTLQVRSCKKPGCNWSQRSSSGSGCTTTREGALVHSAARVGPLRRFVVRVAFCGWSKRKLLGLCYRAVEELSSVEDRDHLRGDRLF